MNYLRRTATILLTDIGAALAAMDSEIASTVLPMYERLFALEGGEPAKRSPARK